jgi:HTH-type transcriptional regulator / antitoxin HipB
MTVRSIRDVAAAVRGRRKDVGLSQAELARRAGVSRKWIYEFEAGKPTAEFGLLLRVLDALELSLELGARSTEGGRAQDDVVDLDALLEDHRGVD